jgi:hypothetical protein
MRTPLALFARLAATLLAAIGLLGAQSAAARPITPLDLALRFQPHLFFDSAELWRPLDVDAFLTEPGHQVCPYPASGAPCVPLTGVDQLDPAAAFIDLRGTQLDGSDAAAPDLATCAKSEPYLLDCDEGGGRSLIYAHVSRAGPRIAIDYWWFLRYNAFLVDLHEGDWEGVTVIVDGSGRRVTAVHFAAHSSSWRYPSGVPTFDGTGHVRVYLARGSHAAYPRPCLRACHQTESTFLPEGRANGRRAWVGNEAAVCARRCVRLFPEAGGVPASWDAWNGLWGVPHSALFPPPRTPAFQARYAHPFAAATTRRRSF